MEFLKKKQVELLELNQWEVRPNGFYITLYSDEMGQSEWEQICKIAGVSSDVTQVTIMAFGVKAETNIF